MMNIYDVGAITLVYLWACVLQAWYQTKLFEEKITISHTRQAVYYLVVCVIVGGAYALGLSLRDGIVVAIYGTIVRLAFFDPILNIFRDKPLLYNGNPNDEEFNSEKESLTDWWENKILRLNEPGGKMRLLILKLCYLLIWAAYVILILIYAIDRKL